MWIVESVAVPREGGGANAPYDFHDFCCCCCLSAHRSVMAMIVPLPHYENVLEQLFQGWRKFYGSRHSSKTFWQFPPPPLLKQTPWHRP